MKYFSLIISLTVTFNCLSQQDASSSNAVDIKRAAAELIAQSYPEEQISWLDSSGKSGLMIKFKNRFKTHYGSVLYLPDRNEAPLLAGINKFINDSLPELGWHTYSLYYPFHFDQSDQYELKHRENINKAINQLGKTANERIFLIVKGNVTQNVIDLLANNRPNIQGMAIINPKVNKSNKESVEKLIQHQIPLIIFPIEGGEPASEDWLLLLRQNKKNAKVIIRPFSNLESLNHSQVIHVQIHRWFKQIILDL